MQEQGVYCTSSELLKHLLLRDFKLRKSPASFDCSQTALIQSCLLMSSCFYNVLVLMRIRDGVKARVSREDTVMGK